jgi:hypothetical protein
MELSGITTLAAGLLVVAATPLFAADQASAASHPPKLERLIKNTQAPDRATREAVAEELKAAAAKPKDPDGLVTAAEEAAAKLGPDSFQGQRLTSAVTTYESTDRSAGNAKTLARTLQAIAEDLAFQPRSEADRPADFPTMTAVGELELKQYPRYRLARAPMDGGNNTAFYKLFNHIKRHNIPMTAPVEIEYTADGEQAERRSMGFLYEHDQQGDLGPDGPVNVEDVPAALVLSIGQRGWTTAEALQAAETRFERWLAERDAQVEAAGPLRVMSWNSPMVPASQRYYEIQQPIRPITDQATAAGAGE